MKHPLRTKVQFYLASLFLVIALGSAQTQPWSPQAKEYRLHMIGNAHIDPVWLWPWAEGLSVVHSTFRSALDRMNETPEFQFTASSGQFYAWVAENDPKMLAEIRKRIEEGRWGLVGGWWVEPDVNIPNGESLARHALYTQRLLRQLFGRTATVGYNPDSFGHTGTLPQILKLQGLEDYVFMRPQSHEKTLPADLFWWEGPDGSRVLTYRIPYSYNDPGCVEDRVRKTLTDLREPVNDLMVFYGVGDHGGGATKENIQSIQRIQSSPGGPVVLFSTPEKYFKEIRTVDGPNLPVVREDLQHHSVGCYTAESGIKKNNRTTEIMLATAEKVGALGSALWDFSYPQAELTASWETILFLQFHDSMAGTSLPEHYIEARNGYGRAMDVASQTISKSLQKLAWQVPAEDPESQYVLVFNPHAWAANLNVEYDFEWDPRTPSVLQDDHGRALAHQWVQASTIIGDRNKLVFQAPLPPFGYRQFRFKKGDGVTPIATGVRAGDGLLENEHLRITWTKDGSTKILDKDTGKELFSGEKSGARAVVLDDPSDTWSHDVRAYTDEVGTFGGAKTRMLESGPFRARVRVRSIYGDSKLETDWILYAGSRTLEARCSLDWHEHHKMLKFSFPVAVDLPRPTYETAFGHIEREPNGDEDPGQRWIDLTGKRGSEEYGLAVINDAKYGYSVLENDMRISIARGPVYAHHQPAKLKPDGEYVWQDQGIQTFRMLLVPHKGSWQSAGVVRLAEEFTAPVPVIFQGIHGGARPQSASFLSVDAPDIVVTALKKAEDGNDLILRCYETDGRTTSASLELALLRRKWKGDFRPFEIKTLRIPLDGGAIREVNFLEE
jgi:alpha-mannosidase